MSLVVDSLLNGLTFDESGPCGVRAEVRAEVLAQLQTLDATQLRKEVQQLLLLGYFLDQREGAAAGAEAIVHLAADAYPDLVAELRAGVSNASQAQLEGVHERFVRFAGVSGTPLASDAPTARLSELNQVPIKG